MYILTLSLCLRKQKGRGHFKGHWRQQVSRLRIVTTEVSVILPPKEIGKTSLHSIIKQGKEGSFNTPESRYRKTRVRNVTDGFDRDAIRRLIYQQYEGNQQITLNKLLVRINLRRINYVH